MSNPNRLVNLEPPKFGCLPIRTTLIVISILGIISSPSALISQTDTSSNFVGFFFGLGINCCVLYGVLNYHDFALGISLRLLNFLLVLNLVLFCTLPVIVASVGTGPVSSSSIITGTTQRPTESEEFMGEEYRKKSNVVNVHYLNIGIVLGFAVEIALAISSAVIYAEIVMIKRFRIHSTAWRDGKAYQQIP